MRWVVLLFTTRSLRPELVMVSHAVWKDYSLFPWLLGYQEEICEQWKEIISHGCYVL